MTIRESQFIYSKEKCEKPLVNNDKLAQSQGNLISKRGILSKVSSHIKRSGSDCPLPFPNNIAPHFAKEEINQLAKVWCELLFNQIQETRNQQKLTECL
jgi:hypothetical protein